LNIEYLLVKCDKVIIPISVVIYLSELINQKKDKSLENAWVPQ